MRALPAPFLTAWLSLWLAAALFASAFARAEVPPSTVGFYPIWENTGFVEPHRQVFIGSNSAHFGIAGIAQVGVEPINFLYRTPNAYVKFRLADNGRWHLGAQVAAFYLMDEASRAFLSPMYSSRLDNPDFAVTMVPVSLVSSYEVSDWLDVHQTATAFSTFTSGQLQNQTYFGYSIVGEFKSSGHSSVQVHVAEIGFWNHDFALLGASYRFANSWLDFQLGYFYRFRQDGTENAPMISLGFRL